jgi:hypothetical protein
MVGTVAEQSVQPDQTLEQTVIHTERVAVVEGERNLLEALLGLEENKERLGFLQQVVQGPREAKMSPVAVVAVVTLVEEEGQHRVMAMEAEQEEAAVDRLIQVQPLQVQ